MPRFSRVLFALLASLSLLQVSCGEPKDLQVKVLTPGSGAEAHEGQLVTVHYTGWLKDGTKFDSSLDRNQPFRFVLGSHQVIPGWEKGVSGMKVGEKRRLVIPSRLAYGDQGAGGVIPPKATLKFEVELLTAEDPKPEQADMTIQVVKKGTGAKAEAGKKVTVHYTGKLLDGTKFDSSLDRKQPFSFVLGQGQVIAGWDRGLDGMRVGEKRKLTIPSRLAYGAQGAGPRIPPFSTLVFDVELLKVGSPDGQR